MASSDPAEVTAQALARPWTYANARLGMTLHPKQEGVLRDLYEPGGRVLFACGNEVGKTSKVAAATILWHSEILKGLTVSTAGAWRQVTKQLVPALKSFSHLFPGWEFNSDSILVNGQYRYIGYSARDQGVFQGFHNTTDAPLLMIIDEAAAVSDEIFLAAEERCNPTRLLIMGSPLDPTGLFYRYRTDLAKFYKQHKLTQPECTTDKGYWLDPAIIARKLDKWGAEHPIVLSSVFADFSLKVEGALLSLREWEAAIESPPEWAGTARHVFLDFAAGRAENVIGVAHGNRAWIASAWREKNTMAAVGEFVARLGKLKKEIGLRPEEVEGDADGMGIVFCDALAEAGWPVGKFRGGSSPRFTNGEYRDLIAEVWTEGTSAIRRREWILPNDEELKGQLISRKTMRDPKGLMRLEAKEDMSKRGIPSPDRADALLGAMAPCPMVSGRQVLGQDDDLAQQFVEQMAGGDSQRWPDGAWAG